MVQRPAILKLINLSNCHFLQNLRVTLSRLLAKKLCHFCHFCIQSLHIITFHTHAFVYLNFLPFLEILQCLNAIFFQTHAIT